MSEVRIKPGESFETAYKRFKRKCTQDGVAAEVNKRRQFVSPSEKRKRKQEESARKKRKFK